MMRKATASVWRGHLGWAVGALLPWSALAGQAPSARDPVRPEASLEVIPMVDTASLARGRYAGMNTLLEKTIFQVDVLTLNMRVGPEESRRLERLADGARYSDALADSVAAVMVAARDVWARIVFERGVSLDRFLGGVMANVKNAWKAGWIEEEEHDQMARDLPRWFGFLEERKIFEGDQLLYRIQGESLRTIFVGADGKVLLDQTDLGASPPRILLGSYFARGSDLRKGLVRSLLEES